MNPTQINIEEVERLTQIAAREGTATLIAVVFIILVMPFLWIQFNRINKTLSVNITILECKDFLLIPYVLVPLLC